MIVQEILQIFYIFQLQILKLDFQNRALTNIQLTASLHLQMELKKS